LILDSVTLTGGEVHDPASIHNEPKIEFVRPIPGALQLISAETEGYMTEAESDLLWHAAESAFNPDGNSWIEVGSYIGKSTVTIAGVLACSVKEKDFNHRVYAVDPHEGKLTFPSHYAPSGLLDGVSRIEESGGTRERFDATITKADLWHWVSVIAHPFTDFHADNEPIGFIFIDGLHDYDSVKADWEHAKKFLKDGATVVFHDYHKWEGVTRTVDEALTAGEIARGEGVDSLYVAQFRKS
jgi:predicted O-methyltransferase YrrM